MEVHGRTYDIALVDAIEEKKRIVDVDGMPLELRPIPDDDRPHALDPRVVEYARSKNAPADPSWHVRNFADERKSYTKPNQYFDEGTLSYKGFFCKFPDRWLFCHSWTPANHKPGSACLLYLHGGGFCTGLMEKYEPSLRHLADISGAVVLYPELRMAPDCPFPGPVDDADDMVSWVAQHADELGIDADKIMLAGDSAGGNLCNGAVLRHKGDGLIKGIVTFYPLVDAKVDTRDATWTYDEYPWLDEQATEAKARVDRIKDPILEHMYVLGDLDKLGDPLISPLHLDDVSFWPRTVMVSSEFCYLRLQDEQFAKKLFDQGVDVRCIRYLGMDHGFFEAGGTGPQAEDLCRVIAGELARL